MARYTSKRHTDDVLAAAQTWREQSLLGEKSVFSQAPLWTEANLASLQQAFIGNPLVGQDSFIDKLTKQLSGTSPQIKKLAAECVWLLYLFVSSDQFGAEGKRERVKALWQLSGEPAPETPLLSDASLEGLAKPGAAFMTKIPDELGYLLDLMIHWRRLEAPRQEALLRDPWALSDWVSTVSGSASRAFRHMFLYFMFPDQFERINSWTHKRRILEKFDAEPATDVSDDQTAIDKGLYELRQRLVTDYGTDQLDYYNPPLSERWQEVTPGPVDPVPPDAVRVWIEKTLVEGRPNRLEGDHALGRALWSPQRSAGDGDIYANMRRTRPGDVVLHLTDNAAITRASIVADNVDDQFIGISGTDWGDQPAYRIELRDSVLLEPPLERSRFLETEPYASRLRAILNSGARNLFYNSKLTLNQGAYLTEAPSALVSILNDAYRSVASKDLPYISVTHHPDEAPAEEASVMDDIVDDLFLDADEIDKILALWTAKKNVILQVPPGVGKSFAARRLAYLLMGDRAKDRVGFVQFHQSYAYEDFIEGYRPTADGFTLRQGKFLEFCRRAEDDPGKRYVFVIDEINRGNLSKILGELLLLIEPDKRDATWAMPLAYSSEEFFVPDNVYLLGLMNTADRSLAVVDYALRRRFGFVELVPKLDSPKFAAALTRNGLSDSIIGLVRSRIGPLNAVIVEDTTNLGQGFAIGHSFFCSAPATSESGEAWYARIVRTEIVPLLREYWFDAGDKVREWEDRLLAGL